MKTAISLLRRFIDAMDAMCDYPDTGADRETLVVIKRDAIAALAAAPQPECVEQQASPEHGWLSMKHAPKDGTAILVLLPYSDVPHAVRWRGQGWVMTWDFHPLSEHDQPRYWMPCPSDPDAAQPQEPSHDDQ